jgi:hypothetical protein
MCGAKFNSSLGGSFDPAADNATAGKQYRVFAARIDNSQFQIAVEWRDRHFVLPHKRSPTRSKAYGVHKTTVQRCLAICGQKFVF